LRLFCFSYAGGAASAYRPWVEKLPTQVEICAVQLPGRERRMREKRFTRIPELVDALGPVLEPLFDRPYVLFGHSLGARIAFEVARWQRGRGRSPERLVVSGSRAPHLVDPDPPVHAMADDELCQEVARLGGTPPEVLRSKELMQLLIPLLRADFELSETYCYEPGPLLEIPVSAYGGDRDPKIPAEAVAAWEEQTRGPFRHRIFSGGHFFHQEHEDAFLREIRRDLVEHL
jgi:medium-chain acyl-[acyl-carrier-protein] hydrolase